MVTTNLVPLSKKKKIKKEVDFNSDAQLIAIQVIAV